jgi:diguanylate cyclase (GGDEF)-like protein
MLGGPVGFLRLFSLNIFSGLCLLIVIFSLVLRRQQYSVHNRLFIHITAVTIFVLVLEIGSWYFEGKPGTAARRCNYIFNFVFLAANPLPAIGWLAYIDYKIHGSVERLKKRGYYLPVLVVPLILMLISLKTELIFGIGPDNTYFRGPGNIVYTVIIFAVIYSSVPMVLINRKYIDKNIFIAFYAFTIFPVLGAVIQLLLPGTLLVWNAVALAVLTTFIFLEIQYLSKDFLTGLYNRRQIDEWINYRVRTAQRGKKRFSLILIDLDDFKRINDVYGHAEGDEALIIFSNILTQCVKAHDIPGRYAGDEFLIALETDKASSAEAVVRRIQNRVEEFNRKQVKPYDIGFSAGSVVFDPGKHESASALFKQVDERMYKNKIKG